jgi:hypothetical protein
VGRPLSAVGRLLAEALASACAFLSTFCSSPPLLIVGGPGARGVHPSCNVKSRFRLPQATGPPGPARAQHLVQTTTPHPHGLGAPLCWRQAQLPGQASFHLPRPCWWSEHPPPHPGLASLLLPPHPSPLIHDGVTEWLLAWLACRTWRQGPQGLGSQP